MVLLETLLKVVKPTARLAGGAECSTTESFLRSAVRLGRRNNVKGQRLVRHWKEKQQASSVRVSEAVEEQRRKKKKQKPPNSGSYQATATSRSLSHAREDFSK